jgi:cohesin domain-containing protein
LPLQINHMARASVTAQDIADLIAFEVHLSFDANVLEVIEINDGGFIAADFIAQNTFDNAAGTIDYAVAQIGHPPANGSGTLFEIVFRAKVPGKSSIRFRETPAAPAGALFSDSNGMAIQVSLINGSVNVGDSGNARLLGTYVLAYRRRASTAGTFKVIPPTASEFYFPDVGGRGAGSLFEVKP